jgi:hypothetical protein
LLWERQKMEFWNESVRKRAEGSFADIGGKISINYWDKLWEVDQLLCEWLAVWWMPIEINYW